MARLRLLLISASAFLGTAATSGCMRTYAPSTPHQATLPEAGVRATAVVTAPAAVAYPPAGAVAVQAVYRVERGAVLSTPRLSQETTPPCEGGVAARVVELAGDTPSGGSDGEPPSTGTLTAVFVRDAIDRAKLLGQEPTALDILVLHADPKAEHGCLRVPIAHAEGAEWTDEPRTSLGYGFGALIPFHRIYGVDAAPMFVIRFGPFVGPLRLRLEGAIGGAAAHAHNPNLVGYAYAGGLLVDTLLFYAGHFGVGATAGYEVTGIDFGTEVPALSDTGSGWKGVLHGPRAGISLSLLPQTPPGPAFRARPNSASGSFEVFGAAEWSRDHDTATPALWFALTLDWGR